MERLSLSDNNSVSTHSRPKAAGVFSTLVFIMQLCFNSQPPEGGWSSHLICLTIARNRFNSQPPEGGWFCTPECANNVKRFNSQPPEGGWASLNLCRRLRRSFNSQPPEGGWFITCWAARVAAFQLTAARRRLVTVTCLC